MDSISKRLGTGYDRSMIRILTHERYSLWTAELERAFSGNPDLTFRWFPYRSDLLTEAPLAQILFLVVSPDDDSLDFIRELRRQNEFAKLVCLITEEDLNWELLAREFGVTAIVPDVTMKSEVVKLIEQVVKNLPPQ